MDFDMDRISNFLANHGTAHKNTRLNGTQNVEHVLASCEYMWDCFDGMIATVSGALQSEPEETQQRWLMAHGVGDK